MIEFKINYDVVITCNLLLSIILFFWSFAFTKKKVSSIISEVIRTILLVLYVIANIATIFYLIVDSGRYRYYDNTLEHYLVEFCLLISMITMIILHTCGYLSSRSETVKKIILICKIGVYLFPLGVFILFELMNGLIYEGIDIKEHVKRLRMLKQN